MTPTQILTAARNKYNSVGDSFYSDAELLSLLWEACNTLANECFLIERTYSTSTVANQQEYSYPSNTIAIKRITYNGNKLKPITFREDDTLSLNNQTTTATGTPQFYAIWNETLYLRPVPSAVGTLKVFAYVEPQELSITSSLETPTQTHMPCVNYLVSEMCAKDENLVMAKFYADKWAEDLNRIKRWQQKKRRGDAFNTVLCEEQLQETILGQV